MEFQNVDLLTVDEFKQILGAQSADTKAELVGKKLKKYCFINENGDFYAKQSNNIYKRDVTGFLFTTAVIQYTTKSYNSFSRAQTDDINDRFKKPEIRAVQHNNFVKVIEPQLRILLTLNRKIELDNYKWRLHFNNGYLDLKTGELKQRIDDKTYPTYCIEKDYEPSTEEDEKRVYTLFKQIFYKPGELEYNFSKIANALIGDPTEDQDMLFIIGKGSNGKSVSMELLAYALGDYVLLFSSSALEKGNSKRDKIFNELGKQTHVRVIWINECTENELDASDFKNLCDGKLVVTRLYIDGQTILSIKGKLVSTSNYFPKVKMDEAIKRRINADEAGSKFVDEDDKVDETKHIFKKDRELLGRLKNDDKFLMAYVNILLKFCMRHSKKQDPKKPQCIIDTTNEIISANDKIQDFVDSKLEITTDSKDRIGKQDMLDKYLITFPGAKMDIQKLIQLLKNKDVIYEPKFRHNDIQGCFAYVKFKKQMINMFEDDKDKQITALHEQNKQLQEQLKQQKTPKDTLNDLINNADVNDEPKSEWVKQLEEQIKHDEQKQQEQPKTKIIIVKPKTNVKKPAKNNIDTAIMNFKMS